MVSVSLQEVLLFLELLGGNIYFPPIRQNVLGFARGFARHAADARPVTKEESPEIFGVPDDDHARTAFFDEVQQTV